MILDLLQKINSKYQGKLRIYIFSLKTEKSTNYIFSFIFLNLRLGFNYKISIRRFYRLSIANINTFK